MDKTRGIKNIVFGLFSQILTIGLGVIIPRLVLVNLGSEANGLLSAIGSVLTYMSLLEAGVGMATIQALYKPIAEQDRESVSAVMSATHYFYRRTGYIYLTLVLLIAVGFTGLIDTTIPRTHVFLVVLMSGLSGVLSYFFQGKFRLLLAAEGKTYVVTNITTITSVGVSILKAVVLFSGGNVVEVQSVYFFFNLVQLAFFMLYMKRHYGWVQYNAKPDFEAIAQKNAVLVHQITGLIFNNTDVLVLTVFTSLKSVSVYSMYAMIYGMVKAVTVNLSDGFIYALGQTFHDRQRFIKLFDVYEVYKMAVTTAVFCITRILMLPFLALYTKGVTDINYIDPYINWLFAAFYLLHNGRQSSGNLIDIAQRFENTKWRSVLEAVINITVSVALTYRLGIYGVLMGTIAALLYRTNDMIIYAAGILGRSPWITYRRWIVNLGLFALVSYIASCIHLGTDNYIRMFVLGIVLCLTVIPLFVVVNSLFETETARHAFNIVKSVFHTRFHKSREA